MADVLCNLTLAALWIALGLSVLFKYPNLYKYRMFLYFIEHRVIQILNSRNLVSKDDLILSEM